MSRAEHVLAAQMLEEMAASRAQLTAIGDRIGQMGARNHVLLVETVALDGAGQASRPFRASAGCVWVSNPGTHTVTVAPGGAQQQAPTVGVGVTVLPAASHGVVPLDSHQMTLYGTAGDVVSIVVYSAGSSPVSA